LGDDLPCFIEDKNRLGFALNLPRNKRSDLVWEQSLVLHLSGDEGAYDGKVAEMVDSDPDPVVLDKPHNRATGQQQGQENDHRECTDHPGLQTEDTDG
jgi:hypothetical protein